MSQQDKFSKLTKKQTEALERQGCSAQDWGAVLAADGFEAESVRNTEFSGQVRLGCFKGKVIDAHGLEKPSGIYNGAIVNCSIGDNVRIANVGVHIANYDIADGVCIEDVSVMQTDAGACFGNGVEVTVLNEAGGREVILFGELNCQIAYLMCLHRYRPKVIEALTAIANEYTRKVKSDRGTVRAGAKICSAKEIVDVNIGGGAVINGAASLKNGTVLSTADGSTVIGTDVVAKDFIIAESSTVSGGVHLDKVFVGQGCQVGKQFSAENSLFFANCEAFHGEACSIFAGPYTVTHHKSSLLIAGLFSFYNAGSGTNQSNHMYKLGPGHEGKLSRGTKTGSFSYMMWPCVTGPFSVVLGKHTRSFDTSDFPFSHLEAGSDGKCSMVPGLYITTVGTVRDGAKWPKRDRRKGCTKRDFISFDVFSPYTVGRMMKGSSILKQLQQETDRSVDSVTAGGAQVKRVLLRTGQKFYRTGIEMYLGEKIIERAEKVVAGGVDAVRKAFDSDKDGVYSEEWVDIGGQLMAKRRLLELTEVVEAGGVKDAAALNEELRRIEQVSAQDQWCWVKKACSEVFGVELDDVTAGQLLKLAESYLKVRTKFLKLVRGDAEKEFGELSQVGFGRDGADDDVRKDFLQVRGEYPDNSFVKEMQSEIEQVEKRVGDFKEKVSAWK